MTPNVPKDGRGGSARMSGAVLAVVFGFLALVALLAWLNNLAIALSWDPSLGQDHVYTGPIPWFDRVAVDFSTVSTFVPFFGLFLMALGFVRIAVAAEGARVSEFYPFHRNHSTLVVGLGLIGTVWGLIMIGCYPMDDVGMSDLLICMRTALYSTLVALIWVFLVVLPVRPIMQKWHRLVSGCLDEGVEVTRELEDFTREVAGAGSQIGTLKGQVGGLGNALIDAAKGTQTAGETIERASRKFEEASGHAAGLVKTMKEARDGLGFEFGYLRDAINAMKADSDRKLAMIEKLESHLAGLLDLVDKQKREIARLTSASASSEAAKTAAEADARKARGESAGLQRRVGELENVLRGARDSADKALVRA